MRRRATPLVAVAALVGFVGVAYLTLKLAPDLFAEKTKGLDAAGRAGARQGVRTATLALLAGAIAVVGAFYTARSYALNRSGQLTDRFTKAIDQLGDQGALDVRLGGIYALERIARDSKDDHPQVIEVLTAFIREHALWPPAPPTQSTNPSPSSSVVLPTGVDAPRSSEPSAGELDLRPPATDVQAALTVVGRRKLEHEQENRPLLRLQFTDLRAADLRWAHLEGAHLWGALLWEAQLRGAHLEGAFLWEALLWGAFLWEADLRRAHLEGAHLEGAHLEGAHLRGAYHNAKTQWPDGFNPKDHGAILVD